MPRSGRTSATPLLPRPEHVSGVGDHKACTRSFLLHPDPPVNVVPRDRDGTLPGVVQQAIAGTSPLRKVVGPITGHPDADRMDDLLRDSLHAGVAHGQYDLEAGLRLRRS